MTLSEIPNWVGGEEVPPTSGRWFNKVNPANGKSLWRVARSGAADVQRAVDAAQAAQSVWASTPAVQRGLALHKVVMALQAHAPEVAEIVAIETGKSMKDALGENAGAVQCGLFFAGEGQRLYARTTTSGVPNKHAMTVREPIGVAGLIVAANTPIANVAWKVFPALICGNTTVLKAAEDAPATAWIVGRLAQEVGLPPGTVNIVQGYGEEAGAPLVENPDVGVISFTGSTEVGRIIQRAAGERLARVSLELGGKNPLIVCDDADLDNAAKWVILSAFSNAGQRCAAGSRVIVFDDIYERFCRMLVERAHALRVGSHDGDDFGPVINLAQLDRMLTAIARARECGARILTGGYRLTDAEHDNGFYLAPTLVDNLSPDDEFSTRELFGPIAGLYRVKNFAESLALANDSPYGLTACIHTRSVHRAIEFVHKVQAGVAVVNAGTYGSEPHMPFGGVKESGNGTREPGTEALDVYSSLKDIYMTLDPTQL